MEDPAYGDASPVLQDVRTEFMNRWFYLRLSSILVILDEECIAKQIVPSAKFTIAFYARERPIQTMAYTSWLV